MTTGFWYIRDDPITARASESKAVTGIYFIFQLEDREVISLSESLFTVEMWIPLKVHLFLFIIHHHHAIRCASKYLNKILFEGARTKTSFHNDRAAANKTQSTWKPQKKLAKREIIINLIISECLVKRMSPINASYLCIIQLIQALNYSVGVQFTDPLTEEELKLRRIVKGQPFNFVVSRNKELKPSSFNNVL